MKNKVIALIFLTVFINNSCAVNLAGNTSGNTPGNTTASPAGSTSGTTDTSAPAAGSVITSASIAAYYPSPLKAGIKWTYFTRIPLDPSSNYEGSTEILDVTAEKVKLRYTATLLGETKTIDSEVTLNDFVSGNSGSQIPTKFTSVLTVEGTENVTVPAGTFNGALKIKNSVTFDNAVLPPVVTHLWYARGTGMIKLQSEGTTQVITELKEFKNG
jgi:hypothetical protein